MKDHYYQRLGVEKTADAQQIKRAYYTLVKQFPPERFPEEFKALRAAYDTLSDAEKRAEYDRAGTLPQDAMYLMEQARKLERVGNYAQAGEVFDKILCLYPDLAQAQAALAKCYKKQGKNGKAIVVWERLCKMEPQNAEYLHDLALSYDQRGWVKKAVAQYHRVLELDSGNAHYWVTLINCVNDTHDYEQARRICLQGIEALREQGRESIRLYSYAAMFAVRDDERDAEPYLQDVLRVLQGGCDPGEHPEETVAFLLELAIQLRSATFVKYIQQMAGCLAHTSDDFRQELAQAGQYVEIEGLEEQGYHVLFHDLFATLDRNCDCEDCECDLMSMECHILADPAAFRPQLLRIKEEYPHLYALHAAFFNEAMRTREPHKLLYRRMKALSKKGVAPAGFTEREELEEFAPPQTVRRTAPKVGRNELCPCGSGRKYKKCCGK